MEISPESMPSEKAYNEYEQYELTKKVEGIIRICHIADGSNDKQMFDDVKTALRTDLGYTGFIGTSIIRDDKEKIGLTLDHPTIKNATFEVEVEFENK